MICVKMWLKFSVCWVVAWSQDGKVKAYGEAGFTGPALLMVKQLYGLRCQTLPFRIYLKPNPGQREDLEDLAVWTRLGSAAYTQAAFEAQATQVVSRLGRIFGSTCGRRESLQPLGTQG